jgi:sulfatase maturation enzyme AslB (radical SAM superfamily)
MQGINFDKQIKNINELVKYRNEYYHKTGYYCSITFQLTFMLNNMHEITDIVKLAADFDIDRIKGHHLWTHFKEIENLSFESNYFSKQKWNEIVNLAYQNIEKYRKPNGNKILLQNFYYLKTDIVSEKQTNLGDCPFLDKELWISATGKISPCCAPDELRNNLGDFGFYPTTKLSDVLNSKNYKELVRNYKNHYICKNCLMRKPL